ncbi:hypothetical protein [Streptomyces sp. NPDC090036]|uniref:hypothetical protein n=1 Tax=Streptomyces sp. NPDC090036 TaxID=3365926 RepID=UPI00381B4C63
MTDRRQEDPQEPDEDIDEKERTRRAGLNPVRPGTAPPTETDERHGEEDHHRNQVPHDEDG